MNDKNPVTHSESLARKALHFALIRCIAALLLAVILLAATGFSVIDLLKGPKVTASIHEEEQGAFVYSEINSIIGFYADETSSSGKVTARYALVPAQGRFVSVRFTNRYLESADMVCDNTYDYINGVIASIDSYIAVQGTVGTLPEDNSALMYDYFGNNKAQLIEIGAIYETGDYADYLSDNVLLVDTVNRLDQTLVIVLSAIAGLLLLYALIELVLMGTGLYLPKPEAGAALVTGAGPKDDISEAPESEGSSEPEGEGAPIGEGAHDSDGEDLGGEADAGRENAPPESGEGEEQ